MAAEPQLVLAAQESVRKPPDGMRVGHCARHLRLNPRSKALTTPPDCARLHRQREIGDAPGQ
jgi:hypothetical protein